MRGGRQFGGALTLQQHRVGEPLDLGDVHPGARRDLLDGGAGPDAGLNILGTQHGFDLAVSGNLSGSRAIAAHRCTQPVVEPDEELVGRVAAFADDVLTVDIQPYKCQLPHVDLLRTGL